jgi:hypothetical protein
MNTYTEGLEVRYDLNCKCLGIAQYRSRRLNMEDDNRHQRVNG